VTQSILLWLALGLPVLGALVSALVRSARGSVRVACATGLGASGLAATLCVLVLRAGDLSVAAGWVRVDALAAVHLLLLALVGGLSSAFALVYFGDELDQGRLSTRQARVFGSLWCAAFVALELLLVSNNLGIMWVGMEATTLVTAFLIAVHVSRESLEAMWKYVLICSVGVAFAFMGTLLAAAAAPRSGAPSALFWTGLLAGASRLDPHLMRAAFVFLLVGYGTKAGLAPMHNWLPDAHSQAPAPVSALFSGFMLNSALYCILRYLPIVDAATGRSGWPQGLLVVFGLASLLVGAGFIAFQHDAKRLLAYCSVEHMGLITIGVGLGGFGTVAALIHSLNHSLAKSLAFWSVGRLGQAFGSHDVARMSGGFRASVAWGVGLFAGLVALTGAAPFATFLSELLILRSAFDSGNGPLFLAMLAGLALAFLGLSRHAIGLAWARSDATPRRLADRPLERALVACALLVLLGLGLGWPQPLLRSALDAARIVNGGAVTLAGMAP
jgi:hydrogenase-4 component F